MVYVTLTVILKDVGRNPTEKILTKIRAIVRGRARNFI